MAFAVHTARRGWATRRLLNTRPLASILDVR